ncbi:MAG: CPBP family intramembrane metalloprotease domain-containing protein [Cyanobium sp. NAT70]|nr:CPBP family intramembrane metalloprotease domain-containing protein [Cyanobium sp. NAT70]|tara:strand:+ start:2524 stop:3849 length:1326 start_codon:yes stop_codon:yes gene_type:complete
MGVWDIPYRGQSETVWYAAVSPSPSRQAVPLWKTLLAIASLLVAALIWGSGLMNSLQRPSVNPSLSLQQQELVLLAEPAVPAGIRPVLVGSDPRDVLLQALRSSSAEQRNQRQETLLALLEHESGEAVDVPLVLVDDPLVQQLSCEAQGGTAESCPDVQVARAAAFRLGFSFGVPLISVLLGLGLLLRQGWGLVRHSKGPWPQVCGPALTLTDLTLLVAGGFVVLSALSVPLIALPIVTVLNTVLESPRRDAVGVVIEYSVMALPALLILWRQLKALDSSCEPRGGWLQWRLRPLSSAVGSAVAGWLMVTPVVMLTGWLLVKTVGDPGGSNPLLEMVLQSRDPLALLLFGMTATVLAPFFEELIFRGALLPVLAKSFGSFWGVLVSALLFGLAHNSIGELGPLTVLGIGLAVVRLGSGRLFPCFLMHALWNAITFTNLLLL